jgi:hypothetical protein
MSVFQGLPQSLEGVSPELGELVQEEHTVMGEANLPGSGNSPTPDQPTIADGVMGSSEGPAPQQRIAGSQDTGDRMNSGRLQGLLECHRGEDTGKPPGQHGLSGPRRPQEQKVMAAGRSDFQGSLHMPLAPNLTQIPPSSILLIQEVHGQHHIGRNPLLAPEMVNDLKERTGPEDIQPIDHGPLGRILSWKNQGLEPSPFAPLRHGENPSYGPEPTIQPQLSNKSRVSEGLGGDSTCAGQQADGKGQVERTSLLPDVGRS